MPPLFSTLYGHRQSTLFILMLTLSIALLSLSPRRQLRMTRVVMMTVLAPIQRTFSFIPSFFHLKQENRVLREELARLQLQMGTRRESIRENIRLRALLGFKKRKEFTYVPAEVIADDAGRVLHAITLDAGSRDGVRPYMAVVTSEGLAGRVIDVGPVSSTVQLLTDRNCRVSAIVQRSRVRGIVAWQYREGLVLKLPVHADTRIGDAIVSSGLGGTFPPGLIIGRVARISLDSMGLFKQVSIAPQVDFDRLEETFVIMPLSHDTATD